LTSSNSLFGGDNDERRRRKAALFEPPKSSVSTPFVIQQLFPESGSFVGGEKEQKKIQT
jgi:hypothetical protein